MSDELASQIREWFQAEKRGCHYRESQRRAGKIDALIEAMPRPLTEAAAAWERWSELERDTSRDDPGLHVAMDLCKYAEWAADKALGLTDEPFTGVPRLVITIGERTCTSQF